MFGRIVNFVHTIGLFHAVAVLVLLIASTTVLINRGGPIATLIAGSAASMGPDTVLYITPVATSSALQVGDTEDVDVRINTKTAVNTVGATISFPQDLVDIVGISKANSFLDLWTEDTTIKESAGEVRFSGGTTAKGGLTGIGTVVTLTVKAKKAGTADLAFKDAEIFAADGHGSPIESSNRDLSLDISAPTTAAASASGAGASGTAAAAMPPISIDFNNDGRVNVVDFSIMAIQVLAPYNAKFDLNRDGAVNLSDLSIFFSRMRQ